MNEICRPEEYTINQIRWNAYHRCNGQSESKIINPLQIQLSTVVITIQGKEMKSPHYEYYEKYLHRLNRSIQKYYE